MAQKNTAEKILDKTAQKFKKAKEVVVKKIAGKAPAIKKGSSRGR